LKSSLASDQWGHLRSGVFSPRPQSSPPSFLLCPCFALVYVLVYVLKCFSTLWKLYGSWWSLTYMCHFVSQWCQLFPVLCPFPGHRNEWWFTFTM
jgi:hypothetical protein